MDIAKKLDLEDFLADFGSFFARKYSRDLLDSYDSHKNAHDSRKNLHENFRDSHDSHKNANLKGDLLLAKMQIDELSKIPFNKPSETKMLNGELALLKKNGVLRLDSICEFVKIIKYFLYLKSLPHLPQISKMLDCIIIPQDILDIANKIDDDGNIRSGWNLHFDSINLEIFNAKKELKKQLDKLLSNPKLSPFLVDKSSHFIDDKETLLLQGGFSAILKGKILHRTQAGFFYVLPTSLSHIYERLQNAKSQREILLYEIEKDISLIFQKHIAFLNFINKEFDRFDALQARVFFAKERNFEFILPSKKNEINLVDFYHPNINNPIPCNVDFQKQILLVTGVNAGGKTMLLKSILSAVFLANALIPFKINPNKSKIPQFSLIEAIINDPQDCKNDISTFAGRMLEFSRILATLQDKNAMILLGIDEIELGTDANEASALYMAILEHLKDKNIKIVITTHHKILASKMADSASIELLAALYDEHNRTPTYHFLKGTIGKSYAFESAMRFGIPHKIIENAKKLHSNELENLNILLEQTSALKANLLQKEAKLNKALELSENKIYELNKLIERQNAELSAKKATLEATYNQALSEVKTLLKHKDTKEIHRFLNKTHKNFSKIPKNSTKKHIDFKIGDRISQGKNIGFITHIKGESVQIELENGVRVKTHKNAINLAPKISPQIPKISVTKSVKSCNVSLDLHGKRVDEAINLLECYISDCLMAGFSEAIIKHGIGSGVLSAVVRDFLSNHPKVASFSDAPPQMGGFGAKIVKF